MNSSVIQPSSRDGSAQAADDALETGIDANLVPLGALPHRPRDAQPIERQDAARIRRPPAEHARQPADLHRKEAPPIGIDHASRARDRRRH